ncbi:DUF5677 domain-containing protein [Gordonia sp. NPDC057258]|uniref:DUF5677 domain-containing protein n=1 Tax=unclassified Gordonia (in: high G+C Gram-positive bacteria) TaxID=2657482 RepID=UPI003642870F
MTTGAPTSAELLELANDVIEGWHRFLDRAPTTSGERLSRAACVYGLAMNNTNLLHFVVRAHSKQVSGLLLMPQIRTIFETGITAQWIAQIEDGANAWINESRRQTEGLVKRLRESSIEVFNEAADPIEKARVDYEELPTKSGKVVRDFSKICDEIGIGADGTYQYYKLMCAFTHPSVDIADEYLVQNADREFGFSVLREPKFNPTDAWLYLAIAGTLWAQMAFQYNAKDRQFRRDLGAIARRIGVPADLKPTDAAWLRMNASGD